SLRHPAPYRSAAQPFVVEFAKELQVLETPDLLARIESEFPGLFQPERRAGFRVEMPGNNVADVCVKLFLGVLRCQGHCGSAAPKRMYQFSSAYFFNLASDCKLAVLSFNFRMMISLSN